MLSLHRLLLGVYTQVPVVVLQESRVQAMPSSQSFWVPAQAPRAQVSNSVHGSPSSQVLALSRLMQPMARSQESSVQALKSSHLASMAVLPQPISGSQVSSVHSTPSLHSTEVPRQRLLIHLSL